MADSSTATAAALFPFILLLLILFAGTSDAVAFHRGLYKDRLPRLGTAVSSSFHLCLTPGVLCKPGEHKLSRFERYKKIDIIKGGAVLTLNRRSLLPIRFLAGKGAASGPSADNGSTVAIVPAAGPSPSPSPSNKHNNRRHKRKVRNWIIGFFVGSVAGVLSGLAASVLFRVLLNCIRGRYRNLGGTEIFSPVFKNKDELAFLEKDDGLADLEVIGSGGSGEVYRKEITTPRGVKLIAIKKIRKHAADGVESLTGQDSRKLNKWMRQIQSEIRTVGRIRHRNLLPLIAHVSRPDCHFLIYEYMKNGSLHDALRDSAEGRREFNWPARHRIAMGVAAGLEHLHMHHQPRVVHRDLKPGNVLLDEDMEARISDFGLAKEIPDANTHMSTRNVAGTIGYIAPEYYQTMKYTTKCDIYSFGVILAAMVMGRFPSDSFFVDTEEMNLVKWMRNQLSTGNAAACFDEKIAGRGHDEQLELVLRVACFCSSDDPKERPSSKDVRVMLAQISNA